MQSNIKSYVKNNLYNILIWGMVIGLTLLYFSLIFNINVTTDEIFSLNVFKLKLPELFKTVATDDHPPLHYLYGHFFDLISSQNIPLQKVAAIIPMSATLVLIATVFRKSFGDLQALFTLLFFAAVPCTMEYAVQIRMYSMSIFFVTLCGLEAYLAYENNKVKNWILLGVATLGAAYTVYFALIAVCFECGILFLAIMINKDKRSTQIKPYIICAVATIALYLPWVPTFFSRTNNLRDDYFLPQMSPSVIWDFFKWTFDLEDIPGFVYLYLILLITVGIIGIICICKRTSHAKFIFIGFLAMLIPTLTTTAGIIISLSGSPIYTGRYVIIEMMMLAIYFGLVVGSIIQDNLVEAKMLNATGNMLSKIAITISIVFLLFSSIVQYAECFRQEYIGHLTEETIAFFDEHLGPNDVVLYNYEAMGFEYKFYFPNDRLYYVRDFDFNSDYENLWFLSNLYEWPITDADCYTYWISYEYMGTWGIEDNNFDVYRYYHNDFPKIEPVGE